MYRIDVNQRLLRPLAVTLLTAVAAHTAVPAALADDGGERTKQRQPELLARDYAARHLSRLATETLLWQACPDEPAAYCVVDDSEKEGHARFIASPAVQRRAVALLAEHDAPAGAYELRVDLLAVEAGGADRLDGLSPAARRGLEARRGELGGGHFTLLDSGFVRTADEAKTTLLADREVYEVYVKLRRGVRGGRIEVRGIQLSASRTTADLTLAVPQPAGVVLTASLDVGLGETTVVGTTRLDEKRDLLLLLTANR